jgi:Pyruvate/2-oxoglutarate dehydrogenase complex, dehydrogenase (E1) component, eukaryotic type, alpha subunit
MIRRVPLLYKSLISKNRCTFAFTKKSNIPYDEEKVEYVSTLKFENYSKPIPTFRVIDLEGNVVSKQYDTNEKELFNKIFETMVRLEEMDTFLLMAQRQGRISFYMPSFGEAACVIGSAAAFKDTDFIYAQYREQGALLWRGYNVQDFVDQCCGNINDHTKGRQMPVHYSSRKHNWATVSSPLSKENEK